MGTDLLYLEDVSVGDSFKSRTLTLTKDEIVTYAEKYDPQPFHLDEELAKDTFFQGLSGSGWNAVSLGMRLIVESVPFAHGIIGVEVNVQWPNPTRPDDNLHVESVVQDIIPSKSKPNQGIIVLESKVINQDDKTVGIMTAKLLNFKRQA